jgi:hypothetical protein
VQGHRFSGETRRGINVHSGHQHLIRPKSIGANRM